MLDYSPTKITPSIQTLPSPNAAQQEALRTSSADSHAKIEMAFLLLYLPIWNFPAVKSDSLLQEMLVRTSAWPTQKRVLVWG